MALHGRTLGGALALGLLAAAEAPRTSNGLEMAVGDAQTARLSAAVSGGVYGGGAGRTAAPQVATLQR